MIRKYVHPLVLLFTFLCTLDSGAEPVTVRHTEGTVRGFVVLKSAGGKPLARGDAMQTVSGGTVTSRTTFHFPDGSVQDETTVFTQSGKFRVLRHHMIQRGPTFPQPMDTLVDAVKGLVTIRYKDSSGKETKIEEKMDLPVDLANGIVATLLKNLAPGATSMQASMLVATPKPRLVTLKMSLSGEDTFYNGGVAQKARRFNVKIDIGGFIGFVASIIGKAPQDLIFWLVDGKPPGFVRFDGQLFQDAPVWRIEMAAPVWEKRK